MNQHHMKPAPEGAENSPASGDGNTGGAGPDGSIPVSAEGISLTTTEEGSNFNQEEDATAGTRRPNQAKPEK